MKNDYHIKQVKALVMLLILLSPIVMSSQAEIMIETKEDSTATLIFQEPASIQSPVEGIKLQYDGVDDFEKLNFISYGEYYDGDFFQYYLDTIVSIRYNGNVGLRDLSPRNQLSLGSRLSRTKLALFESDDNTSVYGMGVTDNTFNFNLSNPNARYAFWNSDGYPNAEVEIITIKGNGNLGITDTDPAHQLSLGNSLANTKIALYESSNNSENYGIGVQDFQFRFNLGNSDAKYSFFDGSGSGANEIFTIEGNGDVLVDGTTVHSSDVNRKENIILISHNDILLKVKNMPVYEWQYKNQIRRHIGPMAQDFHHAFGLGADDKSIASIDADGVALAAIKALAEKVEQLEKEIERLKKLGNR